MPKNFLLSAKKDVDDPEKAVKKKKDKTSLKRQYGTYSGIVDESGKSNDAPSETEAIKNMVGYMKKNNPPESDTPSNVYRPKFSHLGISYDRKKKQTNA